jgi:hypothetical protein
VVKIKRFGTRLNGGSAQTAVIGRRRGEWSDPPVPVTSGQHGTCGETEDARRLNTTTLGVAGPPQSSR